MRRYNNLYDKICNRYNIELADYNARKHKPRRYGIIKHDKVKEQHYNELLHNLQTENYHTSKYSTFKIYEPKERLIFRLPYYPDRILHHAIMNVMEPIWTKLFISSTYSCIKGRGIHKLVKDLRNTLDKNPNDTTYCLKLDIRKFYPSIDHDILFNIIKKKIKDYRLLKLLKEIIDSCDGVPIGNYLSLFFANLYLTYFDHYIKEQLKCKYYFRYADDIVILDNSKEHLSNVLQCIILYLSTNLKLQVKDNHLIFPVQSRGIDIVGYKFYHTHTLLRKSIKYKMYRLINKYIKHLYNFNTLYSRIISYIGWCKFCNSLNLLNSINSKINLSFTNWNGQRNNITNALNSSVYVTLITQYKSNTKINYLYHNTCYTVSTKNNNLIKHLYKLTLPKLIKLKYYV